MNKLIVLSVEEKGIHHPHHNEQLQFWKGIE